MRDTVPLTLSRWLAIAAVCVLASACRPESNLLATASSDTPAATAVSSKQNTWENGMAYTTLRSRLLSEGWVPLPDAQCRANVAGDNHATLCAADPRQCEPCEALPELSACSGTGQCTMRFQVNGGQTLSVSTYGDVHRRAASGEPEDLVVTAVEPATF